jgi:peptide/nickel transport system substrate-binding protein
MVASACASEADQHATLNYGLTLAPTGIDPHLNASAELGIPLTSVYDTLVVQDPATGEVLPSLAERWDVSPDGRTYTFYLRDGVRFHDGSTFDAEAVAANLEYVVDPDHHSQKAVFMLGPFDRAEVIDVRTVALHLGQPFPPLLDSLAQVYLGMASPAALETWGPAEYQFHQVGTGPYRFIEYVPNDHLTLERNPDYAWAPPIYQQPAAGYDRINFRFYEDPATRALALENGEVDVLGEIPPREATRLDAQPQFTLVPVAIPGQPTQFLFNVARPPTDDPLVRQGLIESVDRAAIVETIFSEHSSVSEGPLSTGMWGYAKDSPFPAFDLESAGLRLDQAGWILGDDGRRSRDGVPLSLRIITPNWGSHPEVSQLLEAAWEGIGAEVQVEIAPGFGLLRDAADRGEYNLIGINFFGTDPDLLRPMFTSDGLYNWMNVSDPELDAVLLQAATAPPEPN